MELEYRVVTEGFVSVVITTNKEKCIPMEKTFSKNLTVKDVKKNLELICGLCSDMTINVFDKDDNLNCQLDNDEALLGSYPVDSGMRLHVEGQFVLKKALEDETDVQKYEMPLEEYEKRDETNVSDTSEETLHGVTGGVSKGVGRVIKNNIERLNGVETKPLRRPKSANLITDLSSNKVNNEINDNTPSVDIQDEGVSAISKDNVEKSTISSSDKSVDKSKTNCEISKSSNTLNPNAKEFVPCWNPVVNSNTLSRTTSKIEIIDPKTNLPVELDSPTQETPYVFVSVHDTINQALENNRLHPSDNDNEVNNMLEVIKNMLLCNPGLFSNVMKAMSETFELWLKSDQALSTVARNIIKQCTTEHNYAYLSAKICSELDTFPLTNCTHVWFRGYILSECETEYNKLQETLAGENYREAYGVITFFAELYLQLAIKSRDGVKTETRIKLLGKSLLESLNYLVSDNITVENISFLCRILKLSGWALDEDHPDSMKLFLNSLRAIRNSNQLDEYAKNMLKGILDLAGNCWGRNTVTEVTLSSNAPDCDNTPKSNGHQGDQLSETDLDAEYRFTEDEIKFLEDEYEDFEDGVVLSDSDVWDDEMSDAYEQFLLTLPNNKGRAKK